jgi:hypothetical protein
VILARVIDQEKRMSRVVITLLVLVLTACGGPEADQPEEQNPASSYENALEKARDARSAAEAAMEEARQEIEDNQPPDE